MSTAVYAAADGNLQAVHGGSQLLDAGLLLLRLLRLTVDDGGRGEDGRLRRGHHVVEDAVVVGVGVVVGLVGGGSGMGGVGEVVGHLDQAVELGCQALVYG